MSKLLVEIVSDVVCPWCWVGKRNLETALKQSNRPVSDVKVIWKPFQLRPNSPEEGRLKAPDTPENPRVGHHLREAGNRVGIDFTGKTDRAPNTLKAHTLLRFALEQQEILNDFTIQNQLSEVLFRKYFTDGEFVGDENILAAAAAEVGLDRKEALKYMANESNLRKVRLEAKENSARGVSGVPTFFFNGVPAFSGAQPPERFLSYINQ